MIAGGDSTPALVLDLDGTLVDSVYQHVRAWQETFEDAGVTVPAWLLHRRIGMAGPMLVEAVNRELDAALPEYMREQLPDVHAELYGRRAGELRLLPGARELLAALDEAGVRWALATSGGDDATAHALELLGVDGEGTTIVTSDDVEAGKPDPGMFVRAAGEIGAGAEESILVGDSIWDVLAARRAGGLCVGLLTGGYARAELTEAGAYRVYRDPAELRMRLGELGLPG